MNLKKFNVGEITMSWKDIIKQNKFDFNNLKFEYNKIGENLRAVHNFGEGVEFSIIAGEEHIVNLEM